MIEDSEDSDDSDKQMWREIRRFFLTFLGLIGIIGLFSPILSFPQTLKTLYDEARCCCVPHAFRVGSTAM
jgi:hypothetical protein